MKGSTGILTQVLGTLVAGMIVGIIIAPQKGKKLRKKLKRTAAGWMENTRSIFNARKDDIEDVEEKSPAVIPVT